MIKIESITSRWQWFALSIIFWCIMYYCIQGIFYDFGGDSAQYIILGESLSQGKGLRMLNYPGEPLSTYFPPVFPILLWPILYFLGRNFYVLHLFVALLGYASLFFLYRFFLRYSDKRTANLTVALFATNWVFIIYCAKYILSDIAYLFFSSLTLVIASWYIEKTTSLGRMLLLLIALLASYFTRTIGISLFFAVPIALLAKRDKAGLKGMVLIGAVCVAASLAWHWIAAAGKSMQSHASFFFAVDPYAPYKGSILTHPEYLIFRFSEGATRFFSILADGTFFLFFKKSLFFSDLLCAVMLIFMLLGLWSLLRKYPSCPLHYYFVCYLLIIILWRHNEFIEAARYILPIMPFVLFYFLAGFTMAVKFFSKRAAPYFINTCACALFIGNLLSVSVIAANYPATLDALDAPSKRFIAVHQWIEKNLPSDGVILSRKPSITYFYTNHKAVLYPYTPNPDEIWQEAQKYKVSYIVVDEFSRETAKYLLPFLDKYRDSLILKYRTGNTSLLEIK